MHSTEPLSFRPLFFERVWGGRMLASLFGKDLPPDIPIGESWELVDRTEAESIVDGGTLSGTGLHELWQNHREDIFGKAYTGHPSVRFPLLIKLLDAREKLSVQVHPPAQVAGELGGEPKTEMWHVLHADEGADIFAGLRAGVTRAQFEQALADGSVAECIHRIPTRPGDTIFIPSGRIHAIGAGNVILEVQQNSDTTYRVFDWNRVGLDGKPRELHIEASIRSTNFGDFEPQLTPQRMGTLVDDQLFRVERHSLIDAPLRLAEDGRFAIVFCVSGEVLCAGRKFRSGELFLVPANLRGAECRAVPDSTADVVVTTLPVA